ncbi:MAG: methylated-DNA--[protein]-cysteine S-methyltransferase [Anaerolineae bacterium]
MRPSLQYISSAPNLIAEFHYEADHIIKIVLSFSHNAETNLKIPPESKGLYVKLISKSKNLKLESQINDWLNSYAAKALQKNPLPLKLGCLPPFTRQALEEMAKIPFGRQVSYKQLACLLQNPKGSRAVGNACRVNPFPLVIPCHRVIASNGGLGGFAFGSELKQHLLDFETTQT